MCIAILRHPFLLLSYYVSLLRVDCANFLYATPILSYLHYCLIYLNQYGRFLCSH